MNISSIQNNKINNFNINISSPTTSNTNFSKILQLKYNKPNNKQFMELTGCDFHTACDLLSGVIGSHKDTRDWEKILTANDPIQTIKEETNKMYNDNPPMDKYAKYFSDSDQNIIAKTQNLTLTNTTLTSGRKSTALYLTDANGQDLRMIHKDKDSIVKNMDQLGFDKNQILDLSKQIEDILPDFSKKLKEAYNNLDTQIHLNTTNYYPTQLIFQNK